MATLFNNVEEENSFYNLLAARKLKEIRAERAEYEAEIEEALAKCSEILLSHGADADYIAELEAIEEKIRKEGEVNAG